MGFNVHASRLGPASKSLLLEAVSIRCYLSLSVLLMGTSF